MRISLTGTVVEVIRGSLNASRNSSSQCSQVIKNCRCGIFREGFIFTKFRENNILAKSRNQTVVY